MLLHSALSAMYEKNQKIITETYSNIKKKGYICIMI